jgi:hypothetical protein
LNGILLFFLPHVIYLTKIPSDVDCMATVVKDDWPQWLKDRPEFEGFEFAGKLRPSKLSARREVRRLFNHPFFGGILVRKLYI